MERRDGSDLKAFFDAGSIAVIGSLREWGGHGLGVIKNLFDLGFRGRIYPVSPSRGEVMGLKVYPTVEDVGEPIDLSVVITPRSTVPGLVERCARKGVRGTVIVSEHFAEADGEGARLQKELVEIARRTGIRIMGPNTIGVLNTANGLVTNPYLFDSERMRKGSVAYSSQTGIAAAQCQPLEDRGHPIGKMCDIGNKCDIDEVDVMNYLAEDRGTKVVAMHLEDIRDGRRFMDAARRLVVRKPLLVFKSGRSEAGAKASASHTGSMAGNDQVCDSALKQVGAIRLRNWQEFWDVPNVFASGALPKGNRIGIIVYSGGAGVVAADSAGECGLTVARFSPGTVDRLRKLSPRKAGNPIDLGPISSWAENPAIVQEEAIGAVLDDPNVDCAAIAMYVGRLAPMEYVLDLFGRFMCNVSKPVTVSLYGPKLSEVQETSRQLEARGLPTYIELETAVKALGMAAQYARFRASLDGGVA